MLEKNQQYRDVIAACFQANEMPLTMRQILAWIDSAYPGNDFAKSTLTAQVYKSCKNVNYAQLSSTPKILYFDRGHNTYQRADISPGSYEGVEVKQRSVLEFKAQKLPRFSLESDLKASLMYDLGKLEEGLTLWSLQPPSVEYTFDNGRRVDILAKDRNGIPVVIELKRQDAYDQVIGQALLYRGLLQADLSVERVRIFLVAFAMSDEIKVAASTLEDVELFEYSIHVETQRVSTSVNEE